MSLVTNITSLKETIVIRIVAIVDIVDTDLDELKPSDEECKTLPKTPITNKIIIFDNSFLIFRKPNYVNNQTAVKVASAKPKTSLYL